MENGSPGPEPRTSTGARRRLERVRARPPGFVDELFAAPGTPREHAADLVSTLDGMGRLTLVDLGRRRDEIFRQQGITFAITDPDGASTQDRPFPLDLVPRIIPAAEWDAIERGLAQRLRALNAFIDDVYHGREIVRERIVPWELVLGSPQFRRAVHGVRPPGGIYCHVAGLRPRPRRRRHLAGARGQLPHAVGDLLRAREPPGDDAPGAGAVHRLPRARRSTTTRSCCSAPCARSPRRPVATRPWSSGRRARRTAPTSSTRSSPARWASSWSRPATWSSATTSVTCARPRAWPASTRSTAASTTTSSTRSSSAPTRCSASPG